MESLKAILTNSVFVLNKHEQIDNAVDPETWIFDFRRVLMNGKVANLISDIFYETHVQAYPFQICALEIAGVPLATSIMTKYFYRGHEDINAFFIRKSRKKTGLLRMVEGTIEMNKEIILVDDILNSGNSFWRQVEVLESLGHKVSSVWSIIRYRNIEYYKRFHDRGIRVESLFTLDDFTETLGPRVKNMVSREPLPPHMPFSALWVFKNSTPNLTQVKPKSQPVLDNANIYFGSDDHFFWAIQQRDGSVAWKYPVGSFEQKSIFSNPLLYKNLVIFGAYDGNIYALDRLSGKRVWINFDADWVGSSPVVSDELGLVFIGVEFGLVRKHGGIIAIHVATGKTAWQDNTHPAFTHATPCYIKKHKQVAIGSNDGALRMYEAKSGKFVWKFTTEGGALFDPKSDARFGEGDIKEGCVYSEKHDYLVFGSFDGNLYILERRSGKLVHKYMCEFGIYGTPYLYEDRVYFSSLDKHIRCIDLNTLALVFEKNLDKTRIFASPIIINGRLYVGTNAGRLHELDPLTGEELGYFQANERITNTLAYNADTDTYFLPTYANEIICLKRTPDEK